MLETGGEGSSIVSLHSLVTAKIRLSIIFEPLRGPEPGVTGNIAQVGGDMFLVHSVVDKQFCRRTGVRGVSDPLEDGGQELLGRAGHPQRHRAQLLVLLVSGTLRRTLPRLGPGHGELGDLHHCVETDTPCRR